MALWSTFKWSGGTKWVDGVGVPRLFTSFIDRAAYYVSLKITQVAPIGTMAIPTIHSVSAEAGPRTQLPNQYEAFIDRNEVTQRVSARVVVTLGTGITVPFSIDKIHILAAQRSRRQPSN